MNKIVRVSLFQKGLFTVLLVITPAILALYWVFFNDLLAMDGAGIMEGVNVEDLPILTPVLRMDRLGETDYRGLESLTLPTPPCWRSPREPGFPCWSMCRCPWA